MTQPSWARTEPLGVSPTERLPEHVSSVWTVLLLVGDAVASAIAVLAAGLPFHAVPAVCLVTCAAAWLAGGGRLSYATVRRDQFYHAAAAIVLAAIPIEILLIGIGQFSVWQSLLVLPLAFALVGGVHVGLHAMRYAGLVPQGVNDAVSPRAKRHATAPTTRALKRGVDAAIATVALIVASPLMLVIAIVIARESDGPVFFTQERVGRDRHRFVIYKFRTMHVGSGPAWASPGDERVTRAGAFLRRTSLDELPQLINVLRGEMSLVGPRPEMPEYAHEFRAKIPRYDDRTLVDPGMTGWAQIQGRRTLEPADMDHVVPMDLFYVEHASLTLDLYILVKTLAEVLFHRAA